jgi:hypothetical protein
VVLDLTLTLVAVRIDHIAGGARGIGEGSPPSFGIIRVVNARRVGQLVARIVA